MSVCGHDIVLLKLPTYYGRFTSQHLFVVNESARRPYIELSAVCRCLVQVGTEATDIRKLTHQPTSPRPSGAHALTNVVNSGLSGTELWKLELIRA